MITQYRPAYYDNPRASTLSGLSTDQKPTDVENGARYEEIDTGKTFCFDKENKAWYEMPQSGGGGSSVSVEPITITKNGVTTAPDGVAYSPITTDTYTQDGDKITITEDDGSMVVFTQGEAQAEKTVAIAKNGAFTVEPDAGYSFVKKVSGTVAVPAQEVAMQEVPLDPVPSGDYYSINLSEFFNTYLGITQTVVNGIDIGKYYGKGLEYLKIDVIVTMTWEDGSTNSSKAVLYWGFDSVATLATGMGYNQAVFSNHYGSITAICYNVGGAGEADPILIKFNLNANSLAETMASQAKAAILAANGMTEDEAQSAGITISTSNPVINLFEVQAGGI